MPEVDQLRAALAEVRADYEAAALGIDHELVSSRAVLFKVMQERDRLQAKIAAALALADQWATYDGPSQWASTHRILAARLRETLGGGT
jgi:hypothetical protein